MTFPSRVLHWVLGVSTAVLLVAPGAAAQDEAATPEAETDGLEAALAEFDTWFGEHVVTHLNTVLFFEIGPSPNVFIVQESNEATLGILEDLGYTPREHSEGYLAVTVPEEEQAALREEGIDLTTPDGLQGLKAFPMVRSMPLIVIVLFLGGFFFTFRYGFLNVRLFRHSLDVIRGRYDSPDDEGELSHFKALTSALSATVGLGNIAGVAVAISMGGPGAVFWMWFTAFFGMSMKFSSATFAQLYRHVHPDGRVLGGPMVYLDKGMAEAYPRFAPLGKALAVLFAFLTVFAAFGAGNMFQANQTASIIYGQFFQDSASELGIKLAIGIALAVLVGIVIIGGIRRIGEITSRIVPAMCLFYCLVCLTIIFLNVEQVPAMFRAIFTSAFSPEAMYGGFVGVLVQGMRRAAFSNEAGLGSASIAQAAARTKEPVQAGVVAMLGPSIDTLIVCTMTALSILITDAHVTGEGLEGVEITAEAFAELGAFLPIVLSLAIITFAYSTIISWGYYGERSVEYLVGERGVMPYRVCYVLVIVLGPILSLNSIVAFSDALLLSMAFPNIIGMAIISKKVKGIVDDYVRRLKSGALTVPE